MAYEEEQEEEVEAEEGKKRKRKQRKGGEREGKRERAAGEDQRLQQAKRKPGSCPLYVEHHYTRGEEKGGAGEDVLLTFQHYIPDVGISWAPSPSLEHETW